MGGRVKGFVKCQPTTATALPSQHQPVTATQVAMRLLKHEFPFLLFHTGLEMTSRRSCPDTFLGMEVRLTGLQFSRSFLLPFWKTAGMLVFSPLFRPLSLGIAFCDLLAEQVPCARGRSRDFPWAQKGTLGSGRMSVQPDNVRRQ